jgi:hypothetical protein
VALSASDDEEIAQRALDTLQRTDPRLIGAVVEEADPEWLEILVEKLPHPTVLDAILQRRGLPGGLLEKLAQWVPPELQEALLLRQEDIRASPSILDALEKNPYVSPNSRRVIDEYRAYLLPLRDEDRALSDEEIELIPDEVVNAAIETAAETVPQHGEYDETTGLSEAQIRSLPIPIRVKLAFGASRSLRNILLKDPSPHVSLTALNRSAISQREIEQLCRGRMVSEDVITEITRHREWIGKYRILLAVCRNPRTPVAISLRLLPRLATRDLRMLGVDRNLPDPVRGRASQLYRQKVN